MNCLWLILILLFCGGNGFGIGNGCNDGCNNGCESVGNQSCGYTRRCDDDDCGCNRRRDCDDDCGCNRRPVFDRRDNDTCGCECQDD